MQVNVQTQNTLDRTVDQSIRTFDRARQIPMVPIDYAEN